MSKVLSIDENAASVNELVSAFTGTELLEARTETSRQYEGIVLSLALRIVERRLSLRARDIAGISGLSASALYRVRRGRPLTLGHARLFYLGLVWTLQEKS
jgi:hypothetical protein